MTRWHNYYADGHVHFCTLTVADWRPLLVGKAVDILYHVWEVNRSKLGISVLAYVVMPEHFHIMLWAKEGKLVSAFMRRTASLVSKQLQPGGGFWKERPRVLPVYSREVFQIKLDYIHNNPVKRGLVESPDDWVHSSFGQIAMGHVDPPFTCDIWPEIDL